MTYLIFGASAEQKESKIAELKSQSLPGRESLSFDYEVLHGHKCDPETLRKALLALPLFSPKRFVLLRESHKLTAHNRKLILDFLKEKRQEHLVLVLEADDLKAGDSFVVGLKPYATLIAVESPRSANVFDVTRAMSRQQRPQALKILHGLLAEGQHPLQILGGLVWFWGDSRDAFSGEVFEKGLKVLQEADLNIKRSRLNPDHAVEMAVVKLGALMDKKNAD